MKCKRCGQEKDLLSQRGICRECTEELTRQPDDDLGQMPAPPASTAYVAHPDSDKDFTTMLILTIILGGLGIHRMYAGKVGTGILWLFTAGMFGIGWLVDIIMVATSSFDDSDGARIVSDSKRKSPRVSRVEVVNGPPQTVTDQLAALGKLRDSGVITEQEFNDKKAVLLSKIN